MDHKFISLSLCIVVISLPTLCRAFDEHDEGADHQFAKLEESSHRHKDKILLKTIDRLTFYRHKRTTSRRTHSIHQLSCVGGTAGCKLFTPNVVECENAGFDEAKKRHDWTCQADISDRVQFNHVEVICEGYDYPEDDYILLGSCGLEFTLDYKDPHDYHHNSYFKHMDDHEKEMHRERVQATAKPKSIANQAGSYLGIVQSLMSKLTSHMFLISIILVLTLLSILLLRSLTTRNKFDNPKSKKAC